MYSKRKIFQGRKGYNANPGLLSCRLCESKTSGKAYVTYDYEEITEFPWAVIVSCPDNDHESWYICTECDLAKKRRQQGHNCHVIIDNTTEIPT